MGSKNDFNGSYAISSNLEQLLAILMCGSRRDNIYFGNGSSW